MIENNHHRLNSLDLNLIVFIKIKDYKLKRILRSTRMECIETQIGAKALTQT